MFWFLKNPILSPEGDGSGAGSATAVATGDASAGSGSSPASAAGAASSPGAGSSAGVGASQQTQAEMAQIAKADLDRYTAESGRFRQLKERGDLEYLQDLSRQGLSAKEVRETLAAMQAELPEGVTMKDLLAALRTPSQPAGTRAEQAKPNTGISDDDRPMTVAEYRREQQRIAEEASRTQQQQREAELTEQAEKDQKNFWGDVAKELKIEGGARAKSFRGITSDAEQRVMAEDLQKLDPTLDPDDAYAQASGLIPTKEQLARAKELAIADMKDLHNEIVSKAAEGQAGWPAGTLGGGAGGAVPPPGKTGPLTAQQAADATMAEIRRVARAKGYVPPA